MRMINRECIVTQNQPWFHNRNSDLDFHPGNVDSHPMLAQIPTSRRFHHGMSLVEITLVILLLMTLAGGSLYFGRQIGDWRLGRDAAETLRTVHAAQRMFLSDNPTVQVSTITVEQLLPYLPQGMAAMPTVTSLDDEELEINIGVSPPVVDAGDGVAYDPSGSPNDGLWDIGR